jgi:hypothetical protein
MLAPCPDPAQNSYWQEVLSLSSHHSSCHNLHLILMPTELISNPTFCQF